MRARGGGNSPVVAQDASGCLSTWGGNSACDFPRPMGLHSRRANLPRRRYVGRSGGASGPTAHRRSPSRAPSGSSTASPLPSMSTRKHPHDAGTCAPTTQGSEGRYPLHAATRELATVPSDRTDASARATARYRGTRRAYHRGAGSFPSGSHLGPAAVNLFTLGWQPATINRGSHVIPPTAPPWSDGGYRWRLWRSAPETAGIENSLSKGHTLSQRAVRGKPPHGVGVSGTVGDIRLRAVCRNAQSAHEWPNC